MKTVVRKTALLLVLVCGTQGCTNADREIANNKNGDGIDEFQPRKPPTEPAPGPIDKQKDVSISLEGSDGIEKFNFEPDPKYVKKSTQK